MSDTGSSIPARRRDDAPLSTLRRALETQVQVLQALFFREAGISRGRAFSLGWAMLGLEPLIIVGTVTLLFSIMGRNALYGSNMFLFVGSGVFPVYLFIHTSMRVREPLSAAHSGRYAVEMPLDEVAVHCVLHLLTSAIVGIIYFGTLYLAGVHEALPYDIWGAIKAVIAIFLLGMSMGILNATISRYAPIWDSLWPAVARASIHFSGIYFVADYFSPKIRFLFSINPILHGVSWFRHSFYQFYPNVLNNHHYLLIFSLVALTFGLCLERILRRDVFSGEQSL